MAVVRIDWHWFTAGGNGYHTIDVNVAPPALIVAQVALHGQSGGGTNFVGIMHYERLRPDGSQEPVDFGDDWNNWPPVIFDVITSITFAIATGDDNEAWLFARMDYWE